MNDTLQKSSRFVNRFDAGPFDTARFLEQVEQRDDNARMRVAILAAIPIALLILALLVR